MDKAKLLEGLKKMKEAFLTVQKFTDAKLKDGVTVIRYDAPKLDIGVPVMVVTEAGAIAIPDGDYTLEDESIFTVVSGVVSEVEIKEPVDPAAKPKDDPAAPTPPAAMTEANAKSIIESIVKETHFELTEKINALENSLKENKTVAENFATQKAESEKEIEVLKKDLKESKALMAEAFSLIEKIASLPSGTPAEGKKVEKFNLSAWKKEYRSDLDKQDTN